MSQFLRRLPLMAKLLIIAAISLLFTAYTTSQLYREKSSNLQQIKANLDVIRQSATITRLIDQLQVEREYSFDFALRSIHENEMHLARRRTDSLLSILKNNYRRALHDFENYTFLQRIDSARSKIDGKKFGANQVMHFYSTAVFRFSTLDTRPSFQGILDNVENDLEVQKLFSEMITYQGIISGNIYNILFTKKYVIETLMGTMPAYDVYRLQEKELEEMADHHSLTQLTLLKESETQTKFNQYLVKLFTTFKTDSSYNYEQWRLLAGKSLNEMRTLQLALLSRSEKNIQNYYNSEKAAQSRTLIALGLIIFLIVFFTLLILLNVNSSLRELRVAALKLAAGKADISINLHSKDSIGSLADSIHEVDLKNKELASAAREIGNGNFHVAIKPRSEEDVLGNAIVQMKENLLRSTTDLKKSREEFIQLADLMPQIVYTTNEEGVIEYFNKKWYDITGAQPGRGDKSWIPYLHPDDVGISLTSWYQAVENKENFELEFRLREAATNSFRWFLGRAVPVRDEEGRVVKWFGTCTDIHDNKMQSTRLEEIVMQRTWELNRSNEDLQQFAHVASHDLKEPLRKIRTFSTRLSQEFGESIPDRGKLYMEKLQNSAERMGAMIDGILDYSMVNSSSQKFEPIDLKLVIEGIENDLELLVIQKEATIIYRDLPKINGMPALVHQLFYNLVNNALKFSKTGVAPIIKISSEEITAAELKNIPNIKPSGSYVAITISDNGIGFNQQHADKIFNVFTRLQSKDAYEGTGLGLALCKKIVHRHQGEIFAKSEEGEGASFRIILPAAK